MALEEDFREAMRSLAASVCLITVAHNNARAGLTATAVCSLSLDPPSVIVCVQKGKSTQDLILGARNIGVNILAENQQDFANRFAGVTGLYGEARFAFGDWYTLETGAPLLCGAVAALDCSIEQQVDFHTHGVLFCRVRALRFGDKDKSPLVYAGRSYVGLNFSQLSASN